MRGPHHAPETTFARATSRLRGFGLFDRSFQSALDTRLVPETALPQVLFTTPAERAVSDLTDAPCFLGAGRGPGDTKPHVVVLVRGRVVVAVGRGQVVRVVVPGTAPQRWLFGKFSTRTSSHLV